MIETVSVWGFGLGAKFYPTNQRTDDDDHDDDHDDGRLWLTTG
jgi:hypothetical protein